MINNRKIDVKHRNKKSQKQKINWKSNRIECTRQLLQLWGSLTQKSIQLDSAGHEPETGRAGKGKLKVEDNTEVVLIKQRQSLTQNWQHAGWTDWKNKMLKEMGEAYKEAKKRLHYL